MANYFYIRGLRQVDHTVFAVTEGQKNYWDPVAGRRSPYSSGQQVKRSILDAFVDFLPGNEHRAPITFNYEIAKNKKGELSLGQKEPWNPCDPSYPDQLIGGYMRAQTGIGTIKRRSPLSISAMRPLHGTLANLSQNESGTFDRSDNPNQHPVRVRNEKGEILSDQEVIDFLRNNNRELNRRSWLDLGPRATGLFVYDVAVDLDNLFRVTTNLHEPALSDETRAKLIDQGWSESEGHLYAPNEMQKYLVPALARALVEWRITSNQSRTFSPQPTLAIAISDNANKITNAVRGDLLDDRPTDKPQAVPVIETDLAGVNTFVALTARGILPDITGSASAMDEAISAIEQKLKSAIAR